MTTNEQRKVELLIKRLEADKLIYRFCEYAEISYDTYYRIKTGDASVKPKTLKRTLSSYVAFDAKLKKEAKKIEAQVVTTTPESINYTPKQEREARQEASRVELAEYRVQNKYELKAYRRMNNVVKPINQ